MMTEFRYRPDIDGMRAIAVMMVLLFHCNLGMPGGYVGVDVFFVISGFLITSIIQKDLSNQSFQLRSFWIRRVRRILPAATVMVLATLAAGAVLLLPRDFAELADSVVAQQLMASNLYFWRSTGYFATAAELKPLLHTWSLAVEEQFYLFFPLLLMFCTRFKKRTTLLLLLGLGGASLLLSVVAVYRSPAATFFLLPMRMWEMLLGAILVYLKPPLNWPRVLREMSSWLGLGAIGFSAVFYNSSTAFPGAAALLPCCGAAALIYTSTSEPTRLARLLSDKRLVFVGLLSYSLYLWHWPILAYLRYTLGTQLSPLVGLNAIAASFACAYLSWRFVETPFRRGFSHSSGRRVALTTAIAMATLIVAAAFLHVYEGLPGRLPQETRQMVSNPRWPAKGFDAHPETVGWRIGANQESANSQEPIDYFVWGDSHGFVLNGLMHQLGLENKLVGVNASNGGNPPLLRTWIPGKGKESLLDWNESRLEFIKNRNVSNVILACRWSVHIHGRPHIPLNGTQDVLLCDAQSPQGDRQNAPAVFGRALDHTLAELEKAGVKVWLMKQVPLQSREPNRLIFRSALFGLVPLGVSLEEHQKRQHLANATIDAIAARYPNVTVLDPTEYCFDATHHARIFDASGVYYVDKDHLSPLGAEQLLRPMFAGVFEEIRYRKAKSPEVYFADGFSTTEQR